MRTHLYEAIAEQIDSDRKWIFPNLPVVIEQGRGGSVLSSLFASRVKSQFMRCEHAEWREPLYTSGGENGEDRVSHR